jgi:hypothetical protein
MTNEKGTAADDATGTAGPPSSGERALVDMPLEDLGRAVAQAKEARRAAAPAEPGE